MLLPKYNLVTFTWGNVSEIDRETGLFAIKPSGVDYDKLKPEDMVVMDLNMNKIESRPIPGRNWEYRFFVDFEGNLADAAVKNAIRGLREEALNLKILGNY